MNEIDDTTSPDEQPERANTLAVREHRWRHRGEITERQKLAAYMRTPKAKLERQWTRRWARISEEEKASVLALHQTAITAIREIVEVIDGLGTKQPGVDMPWPHITYTDFAAVPRSNDYPNAEVAACLTVEEFDALDDDNFKLYGRVSKVPVVLWSELSRLTLDWSRANPGACDPAVSAELEATVISNIHTPAPAPTLLPGVRTPTRSEEASIQEHRRNVAMHQRIVEGSVWNSDVNR